MPRGKSDSPQGWRSSIVIEAYYAYLDKRELYQFGCSRSGTGRGWQVNEDELKKRLEILRIEHRDLDAAIDALTGAGATDQLQIARLKKRKLKLKDQIALIEDYLIPDIIA